MCQLLGGPTGYFARHFGRKVHRRLWAPLVRIFLLLLLLREAALLVQVKAIVGREALQESADPVTPRDLRLGTRLEKNCKKKIAESRI